MFRTFFNVKVFFHEQNTRENIQGKVVFLCSFTDVIVMQAKLFCFLHRVLFLHQEN